MTDDRDTTDLRVEAILATAFFEARPWLQPDPDDDPELEEGPNARSGPHQPDA